MVFHPGTEPRNVAKVIDNQRTLRIYAPMRHGLDVVIDKLQRIAESDDWLENVQFRQSTDIWNQKGCLTPYQLWTTYRISTLQLNLYHPGRVVFSACPSNAGCRDTKETVSHIVWTCKRAQAIWTFFFERWLGTKMSEGKLPIFLPHIASGTPPTTKQSLWRRLETQYSFVTEDHETAMQVIWFMATTCIPVLLWRTRNDTVHNANSITVEDSTKHIWDACRMQIRAVAKRKGVKRGKKIAALCILQVLSILEHGEPLNRSMDWTTARLYFGGGARGNPGPGDSGWALLLFHDSTKTWQLKACGWIGAMRTDPPKYDIYLEVYGHSQTIVAVHNGVATIKQLALRQMNQRVQQLCGQFAWMTWRHTKREHNKMADILANAAMNAKSSKVLTEHTSGLDTPLWATVEAHLANDIRTSPSAMRQTPLSSVLSRTRHS